jgi:hypothetical protein
VQASQDVLQVVKAVAVALVPEMVEVPSLSVWLSSLKGLLEVHVQEEADS